MKLHCRARLKFRILKSGRKCNSFFRFDKAAVWEKPSGSGVLAPAPVRYLLYLPVKFLYMIKMLVADASHTREVAALLAGLFEEVEHTLSFEEIAEIFAEIDADDHHSTLLAVNGDEEVVGLITLVESLSLSAGGRYGVVNELFVVPAYRSEGVGKMLLDFAKEIGEQRGWTRIELTTPGDEFDKTLRFYEREGFWKIGPRYKFTY